MLLDKKLIFCTVVTGPARRLRTVSTLHTKSIRCHLTQIIEERKNTSSFKILSFTFRFEIVYFGTTGMVRHTYHVTTGKPVA